MKSEEITEKERKYTRLFGLVMSIIGLSMIIFQLFFYLLGIPRTDIDTLTGIALGFMLAQLGIDFMIFSWVRKIEMRR